MDTDPVGTWLASEGKKLGPKVFGKVLAVWEGRVIAVGENMLEAANAGDRIAPPGEFVLVSIHDIDGIYGPRDEVAPFHVRGSRGET